MVFKHNIQGQVRVMLISLAVGGPLWRVAENGADAVVVVEVVAASDGVEVQGDLESCSLSRWP